jgi:hypothetical protein
MLVSQSTRVIAIGALLIASVAIPANAEARTPAATQATAVAHATGVSTVVAPKKYKNCAALNKVYKHGVAKKKGVRDKTSGVPVRNYTVNLKVYNLNYKSLDRDKDGIACEKH